MNKLLASLSRSLLMAGATLALLAPSLVAQRSAIEPRVVRGIAEAWSVAPDRIRLEWLDSVPSLGGDAAVRLSAPTGTGPASVTWMVLIGGTTSAPRAIRVRAGTEERVAVAARALGRDEELSDGDIAWRTEVRWGSPTPEQQAPGAGWVTRRVIAAGEPLRPPAVARAQMVRSGEQVEAVWMGPGVELRVRGTAAGSAALGERITVRLDNRRRLEGIVTAPRTVRIDNSTR